MRPREWYWRRAKFKFKLLVVYFCVTRPQYEKAYGVNGKFSADELLRQLDFLDKWKSRPGYFKTRHAREYAEYDRNFNYTFSIPNGLIRDVLGQWRDESGKTARIPVKKMVAELKAEGFLKKCGHGTKTERDDAGKWHVKCWWDTKYLLANKKYWLKLMSMEKWADYTKWPRDDEGFTQEVVEKIAKWRNGKVEDATRKKVSSILTKLYLGEIGREVAILRLEEHIHNELAVKLIDDAERAKNEQERVR